MKSKIMFISRMGIISAATCFALSSVHAQDVSGHETVDNPHLRKTTPTPAASAAATKLSQKDQKFVSQVAAGGIQEVADAQVAESQGNENTKKIASRIVSERGANNKELMALAKKKGIGLGTDKIKPRSMGKSNFDKQYIYTTTHDYQEDVSLFQKEAQSGDDKDLKSWASNTLPMLKTHLGMLKGAGK